MPEQHVDYRDLTREEKLEVLESLAVLAIDIVFKHPDILERSLVECMAVRHEYGYIACIGIFRAIKQGRIVVRDDGYHTFLRAQSEVEGSE